MGIEFVFLILAVLVVAFGIGVIVVNRRRTASGTPARNRRSPRRPRLPELPGQAPAQRSRNVRSRPNPSRRRSSNPKSSRSHGPSVSGFRRRARRSRARSPACSAVAPSTTTRSTTSKRRCSVPMSASGHDGVDRRVAQQGRLQGDHRAAGSCSTSCRREMTARLEVATARWRSSRASPGARTSGCSSA